MSCPPAGDGPESATQRPTHNWRPTVVQGAALWLLLAVALAAPLGGALELGVALAGLFIAPVLPVALCCDYRQARRYGECSPGVVPYLENLGVDLATTLTRDEPLGSARGQAGEC